MQVFIRIFLCALIFLAAEKSDRLLIAAEADIDPGFFWQNCRNPDFGGRAVPFSDGKLIEGRASCLPKVLYTWQSKGFVEEMLKDSWDEDILPFAEPDGLFSAMTPIGTYGYGHVSIRMRLKDSVKFKLLVDDSRRCDLRSELEKAETVYLSYLPYCNDFIEYWLCSSKVIESWSVGLLPHLEEMKNERSWVDLENHRTSTNQRYLRALNPRGIYGISTNPFQTSVDTFYLPLVDWDVSRLDANIFVMQEMVKAKTGRLVQRDRKSKKRHLDADLPQKIVKRKLFHPGDEDIAKHFFKDRPNYLNTPAELPSEEPGAYVEF